MKKTDDLTLCNTTNLAITMRNEGLNYSKNIIKYLKEFKSKIKKEDRKLHLKLTVLLKNAIMYVPFFIQII